MPCNDVTETMRIVIDSKDRLVSYRLRKSTCGKAIGPESYLLDHLQQRSILEIINLDADSLRNNYKAQSDIEDFLRLKHFFALKLVLETFTGRQIGGGSDAACKIAEISYDPEGGIIEAEIAVNIVTEMIKACGPSGNVPKSS